MHPDEPCALFLRTEDEINAVRKVFGLTENSVNEGVDSIMEWFKKQPHLAHIDISNAIVEMMIIIAKGSIERAKEKLDNYYKYRFLLPEMIQNRKEILCSTNKIWDMYAIVPLPKLQDNRRIHIVKFGEDLSKFDIGELFKKLCLHLDMRMVYDYMAGDIWIIDMENVGWAQILTQNPLVFKKISNFFTKSLNWRIYGIHIINMAASAAIIQRVIDFFKQFMSSIIMDRLLVHDSLEDLYKYVPIEVLPEDYGGNALSLHTLTEISENVYRKPEIIEYLLECSKMVSDESLRPRDEKSDEYITGSFRKLEVD